jgi:hypothetical protein
VKVQQFTSSATTVSYEISSLRNSSKCYLAENIAVLSSARVTKADGQGIREFKHCTSASRECKHVLHVHSLSVMSARIYISSMRLQACPAFSFII